jgi:hypothetical protein
VPAADFASYPGKVETAAGRVDTDASDAQREALNYRHGRAHLHGLDVMIEVPKGAVRTGVGADGSRWSRRMHAHYGRIKRTVGRDGEPVDVFIGDHPDSQLVFVMSQLQASGDLDEHKCVLGCKNLTEARELYLCHYPANWARTRLGEVRGMTMADFKRWLASEAPVKRRTKRSAEEEGLALLMATLTSIYGGTP